jgi:hypothetical protein
MDKIRKLQKDYMKGGISRVSKKIFRYAIVSPYLSSSVFLQSTLEFGTNILNEEWDLLIILDTCRSDALKQLTNEYQFINDVSSRWSVGGDSWEWMTNTFTRDHIDEIGNTVLITANSSSRTVLEKHYAENQDGNDLYRKKIKRLRKYNRNISDLANPSDFKKYAPVYGHTLDTKKKKIPNPRKVTDYGISVDRTDDVDRIILHYMLPHSPYYATYNNGERDILDEPRDTSFDAYLDNLRWALDEVSLVINNVNREQVIITADHGESFSSVGVNHIGGSLKPETRYVPWVTTTAKDLDEYSPDTRPETTDSSESTEDLLRPLGYLD